MPWSTSYSNGNLLLFFNNTTFANVGNAAGIVGTSGAGSPGSLYFSLHNASPGVGGNQTTNETAYTSYARVAVPRSNVGFTVTSNAVALASTISFPACTGTGDTITYFGLGTASSGTGILLAYGPLTTTIPNAFVGLSATSQVTVPGITFTTGQQVTFYAPTGSTMPGGLTADTVYYVKTVTGDAFTVSATNGGSAITISADGSGLCSLVTPLVVTSSPAVTPQLASGLSLSSF